VVSTVCLGLNYIGFTWGLQLTSPNITQVFIQIGPVLLALSGILLFREKLGRIQVFGFFLVLTGMLVFYREQLLHLTQEISRYRIGVLLTLFGGITWAIYAVLQKILVRTHFPMELNLFLFGLPALVFLPFVNFQHFSHLASIDWIILIFLGLNTMVSYSTLAYAFKHLEANKVSVIITLNPIITFAGMGLFTYMKVTWIAPEYLTLLTLVGALIVLLGVVFTITGRKKSARNL
jgi:drug/metabolite transporter (DMT)-like permease